VPEVRGHHQRREGVLLMANIVTRRQDECPVCARGRVAPGRMTCSTFCDEVAKRVWAFSDDEVAGHE